MIVEFLDINDEVIGTIRTTLIGLSASGVGRTILEGHRRPSAPQDSDAKLMNKYSDWSNGYERSRVRDA